MKTFITMVCGSCFRNFELFRRRCLRRRRNLPRGKRVGCNTSSSDKEIHWKSTKCHLKSLIFRGFRVLLGRKSTPSGFAPPRNVIWDNIKSYFFRKFSDANFRQCFFHHFDSETVQCVKQSEHKEILLKLTEKTAPFWVLRLRERSEKTTGES